MQNLTDSLIDNRDRVEMLPTKELEPHPLQPRKRFDAKGMEELKASIQEQGILNPLLVMQVSRPESEKGYALYILSGERRWRAALELGLEQVPCLLLTRQSDQLAHQDTQIQLLLGANLQKQLSYFEKGRALLSLFSLMFEQLEPGMGLEQTSHCLRYLANPHARVSPPPDWLLESFTPLRRVLAEKCQAVGFSLGELGKFLAAYDGLHPLAVWALEEGHTYWEGALRISAWIKKIRKAFPDHPALKDESLKEFIKAIGNQEKSDLLFSLNRKKAELGLAAKHVPSASQRFYQYLKRVSRLSAKLPEEQQQEARNLIVEIEKSLKQLDHLYSQAGIQVFKQRR